MQVTSVSRQSFKNLSINPNLISKIFWENPSRLVSDLEKIQKNIRKNRLNKKRFVDIILDESNDKIVATISSKKQGTPFHPDAIHYIKATPKGLKTFKNWVDSWNYLYNPKTIEKIKKTYELANSGIIARLYPKK